MKIKIKQYSIDMLFVLALFTTFAITALLLVFSGTSVFENITLNLESTFASRTAVAYLKKQIDQNGIPDSISVDYVEDSEALRIDKVEADAHYVRYIYLHDGYLCELYTIATIEPKLSAGQAMVKLSSFDIVEEGQLLTFKVTDQNEASLSLTVAIP